MIEIAKTHAGRILAAGKVENKQADKFTLTGVEWDKKNKKEIERKIELSATSAVQNMLKMKNNDFVAVVYCPDAENVNAGTVEHILLENEACPIKWIMQGGQNEGKEEKRWLVNGSIASIKGLNEKGNAYKLSFRDIKKESSDDFVGTPFEGNYGTSYWMNTTVFNSSYNSKSNAKPYWGIDRASNVLHTNTSGVFFIREKQWTPPQGETMTLYNMIKWVLRDNVKEEKAAPTQPTQNIATQQPMPQQIQAVPQQSMQELPFL